MTSEGLSLDWLLTGMGDKHTRGDVIGSDYKGLNRDVLWIALNIVVRELFHADSEEEVTIANLLNRDWLSYVFDLLYIHYPLVLKSKPAWEGSALIEKDEVIEALIVEYRLNDLFQYRGPIPTQTPKR